MTHAKITFSNGDIINTSINGTADEIKKYYLGRFFNLGSVGDNMQKATKCEIL